MFYNLPIELHVRILVECDLRTLGCVAKTSQSLKCILETHSEIWSHLNTKLFPNFVFSQIEQLQFGVTGLGFFKFLKINLTNETDPLQITDTSFECRDCIVVPYGILAKVFSFPWIPTPNILVYLRYSDRLKLGYGKDSLTPTTLGKISILNVIQTLLFQFENNRFSQIRCTFLGAVDSTLSSSFQAGERLADVSLTFPSFIELRSIDDTKSSETFKLRIFTILKTPNEQYVFYSGMNRSLGTSMKFFSQLNSHYLTFFGGTFL